MSLSRDKIERSILTKASKNVASIDKIVKNPKMALQSTGIKNNGVKENSHHLLTKEAFCSINDFNYPSLKNICKNSEISLFRENNFKMFPSPHKRFFETSNSKKMSRQFFKREEQLELNFRFLDSLKSLHTQTNFDF